MFCTTESLWAPRTRADGSLKLPLCAAVSVEAAVAGAGEGVAGASPDGAVAGTGAAGTAGVEAGFEL